MKIPNPPRFAEMLFDWYCRHAKVEDLKGDIDELFHKNAKSKSLSYAKKIYWKQVISLVTSYAVKKRKQNARHSFYSSNSVSLSMLKNYVIVAGRNIYKHKYFSLINVAGLSIGMSVSLLLISLLSYVDSYDDFHLKKNNIYSISSQRIEGVEATDLSSAPTVLADKIKNEFVGINELIRINSTLNGEVLVKNEAVPLRGYYADSDFLSLFTFEMMEGNPASVLQSPNSIVLTESTAKKIFASYDVVGKVVELPGVGSFTVTGLMKDHPKNSHLKFEALVSYNSLPSSSFSSEEQWTNYRNQYIYVNLPDEETAVKLQSYLNTVSKTIYSSFPVKASFQVQPLESLVTKDLQNAIGPKWEASGFWVFGVVALLILLPACFNYTNISIARALKRSKEIGLRKAMGGLKDQIFFQFLMETIVITLISLVGALLLFLMARSEFQSMLVDASATDLSLTVKNVSLFILFALVTGTVAGLFPAIYFARLNPIQALKSQSQGKASSGMRLRKALTTFQFALTFGFILCLVVFGRQYRYSLNYDFGFHKENILNLEIKDTDPQIVKTEFSKVASVESVSLSSGNIGLGAPVTIVHHPKTDDSTEVAQLFVDDQFIQNFGLKYLAGGNFKEESSTVETSIIVNEEFLKAFKISSENAIGQTYKVDEQELKIVGVLKNFHFASLLIPIEPFFFRSNSKEYRMANLKIVSDDTHESITAIEKVWRTIGQDQKFEARFFDDEIDEAYSFYETLLKIVGFLGLLALSISLLGLLGMVVYTSENRTKEVGIRKVMGASIWNITYLLSKEYLRLMILASVLILPLAILFMDKLLASQQYYSITLSAWDIVVSIIILMVFGLSTIASQTVKTASINPADTLRCE